MCIGPVVKCKTGDREVRDLNPALCIVSAFGIFFFLSSE